MEQVAALVKEIEAFCRQAGLAETTFGRQAVNDGKLMRRLREGKGITLKTMERARAYMQNHASGNGAGAAGKLAQPTDRRSPGLARPIFTPVSPMPLTQRTDVLRAKRIEPGKPAGVEEGGREFRFYDNRQKYLMFVNTCNEKWVVAERVAKELALISPSPPAMRVFDAGMGDGSVVTQVMRRMHKRFPNVPFYIVGKEISLEDVRLTLEKLPDRFYEHPATAMVITNLYYTEAPWLSPRSLNAAAALNWKEVALTGDSAADYDEQIKDLQSFLADGWQAKASPKTGNPLYVRPSILVIYREDHKFMLDRVLPRRGQNDANYDLVIASQPYRARMPAQFKVEKVLAPLARALGPGGRMIVVHSAGDDPGLEIVRKIWPNEQPFITDRHTLLRVMKHELGKSERDLNFNTYADNRAIFQYHMHTLPTEIGEAIGTSTAFAAWNNSVYVAQIEDQRLEPVMKDGSYLEATREVLHKHGGLWFNDESFVISRRRK
ncbi:MAG TPA: hypothetical protein VEH07_10270 [Alphaproteobacteria bacterium]|nr:hypothetical protein [Alphaproteobacteria bacterium]